MQEIRVLGHLPGWTKEAPLASRLKRAKASEELSASQLAELEAMPPCSRRVTGASATEILMTEIRTFGRFPSRQSVDIKEHRLAERLRHFQRKNLLSASQLVELEQMPRTEPRDASQLAAERPEILMEEIRALGHLPRRTKDMRLSLRCTNVCRTRRAIVSSVSHSLLSWQGCRHVASRTRQNGWCLW